jgi:putative Mn2+ efflux pump MntP
MTGVGLAADACAVAAARALGAGRSNWRQALRMGVVFGFFQGVMPLIGGLLALSVSTWLAAVDHWIASIVLCGLGGKLAWEAWHPDPDTDTGWPSWKTLLLLGVATSIDAAAAGVGLSALGRNLWIDSAIIALVTLVLSSLAGLLAPRLGRHFGHWAGGIGAVVLIGMGITVLVTHVRDHT